MQDANEDELRSEFRCDRAAPFRQVPTIEDRGCSYDIVVMGGMMGMNAVYIFFWFSFLSLFVFTSIFCNFFQDLDTDDHDQ